MATAIRTGKNVEVAELTTTTSVTTVTPDGRISTDTAAGPIRVQPKGADGKADEWVPVDTTLVRDTDGIRPKAVVGERLFSAGGTDAREAQVMASLRGEDGQGLDFTWPEALPSPTLSGDTATYADVLPDTDLVLTATRSGFSQKFVVRSKPKNAAELSQLTEVTIPVEAVGAVVKEGRGGQLELRDEDGELLAQAGAPLMWDAKVDARSGQPAKVKELDVQVQQIDPLISSSDPSSTSNVTLTGAAKLLTDPATVYPVTIDPSPALAALGDTFVQNNISSTPQGGSAELKVGTYNGGAQVNRSLLKFDVAPIKNKPVTSATLSVWNKYSASCAARSVDLHEVADFDANTVVWGNQPAGRGIKATASGAFGYSSACPARAIAFNVTALAKAYATNTASVLAVALTAPETDPLAWKIFNSGNATSNVPVMTVSYDECSLYNGYRVCGIIRDKYQAMGGPVSYLGNPTTDELGTPDGVGRYNHFSGGSIYWTSGTGAHPIRGVIRDKWASMGWEKSFLGYPTSDENNLSGGNSNHFQGGSIFYSNATGAHFVKGMIRDRWSQLGWQASSLGYPTTDEVATPAGTGAYNHFQGGSIYYSARSGARAVQGKIRDAWSALEREAGSMGYPLSDEYTSGSLRRSDFEGGYITFDPATGIANPVTSDDVEFGIVSTTLSVNSGLTEESIIMNYGGDQEKITKLAAGSTINDASEMNYPLDGTSFTDDSSDPYNSEFVLLNGSTPDTNPDDPEPAEQTVINFKAAPRDPSYKVWASWRDVNGRTIYLRQGYYDAARDRGFGLTKITQKHNLTTAAVRAGTRTVKPRYVSGEKWEYAVPVYDVRCGRGLGVFRRCYVKSQVTLLTSVDFRRVDPTQTRDNSTMGVITSHCPPVQGRCPDYVKNAINKVQ
ncbi:DNRLRE domain-containing protein [Kineococcus indalonis]|uniref:DNRLRE domain-containing protein n=1 Tax=Kineococcus indalonis TaxID=2696566 RepID=UPI00196AA21E|nr:DNRLRE domain-containing protein [Kineococcus indalonis]